MYSSKINAIQLIRDMKKEIDVAVKVPMRIYADAINYVQQMLYGEIIREEAQVVYSATLSVTSNGLTNNIKIYPNDNNPSVTSFVITPSLTSAELEVQDGIRYEDINHVYWNGVELMRCDLRDCLLLPDTYAKYKDKIIVSIDDNTKNREEQRVSLLYTVRPIQIVAEGENITDVEIALPTEFIEMLKAYMRGAAYKSANEDGLAAKYLNDFNNSLETFKAWVGSHR